MHKTKSVVSKAQSLKVPTLPAPLAPNIKPGIYWWEMVANVSKAFGKSEAQVESACAYHGLAKVVEEYNLERRVKAITAIISISYTDDTVESLGFIDGQIVYYNGKKLKVLTLKESSAYYIKIYKGWMTHDGDHDCDEDALMRWHGMIAKAL